MLARTRFLVAALVLASGVDAQAGGRRRKAAHRGCQPVRVCSPAPAPVPVGYAPASVPAPASNPVQTTASPTPTPAPAPTAQPTYTYDAGPEGRPAYYYTYDASGKLVVQQWMDWVFRGGRAEGQPRPPLPIIGRIGRD